MTDLAVFDLETTGIDAHNDRIVTAFFGTLNHEGKLQHEKEWIVDPGVDIPTGASDVHGWPKERLDAFEGTRHDPEAVTREIASFIWQLCGPNQPRPLPLVGHNVSYDLTMLNAHLARDGAPLLPFGPGGIQVLDSLVLDKHFNKYVRGKGQRKLTPTAARYGIILTEEEAHNASFDAMASGRITQAILRRYAPTATIAQLHQSQIGWYAEDQASLEKYLRKEDPTITVDKDWPTHKKENAA